MQMLTIDKDGRIRNAEARAADLMLIRNEHGRIDVYNTEGDYLTSIFPTDSRDLTDSTLSMAMTLWKFAYDLGVKHGEISKAVEIRFALGCN